MLPTRWSGGLEKQDPYKLLLVKGRMAGSESSTAISQDVSGGRSQCGKTETEQRQTDPYISLRPGLRPLGATHWQSQKRGGDRGRC